MLHDTTALGRNYSSTESSRYLRAHNEASRLVSHGTPPPAQPLSVRSPRVFVGCHRRARKHLSRRPCSCHTVTQSHDLTHTDTHTHRDSWNSSATGNVHNRAAWSSARRRCSALGLGYDSKFSLPCGVLMAGNAAGFSGLQLPSSSSILLPTSLISLLLLASRARQADPSPLCVRALTALVSNDETRKREKTRSGNAKDREGGGIRVRGNGRGKETKRQGMEARSKLFAVPPCRKCSTPARSL